MHIPIKIKKFDLLALISITYKDIYSFIIVADQLRACIACHVRHYLCIVTDTEYVCVCPRALYILLILLFADRIIE